MNRMFTQNERTLVYCFEFLAQFVIQSVFSFLRLVAAG